MLLLHVRQIIVQNLCVFWSFRGHSPALSCCSLNEALVLVICVTDASPLNSYDWTSVTRESSALMNMRTATSEFLETDLCAKLWHMDRTKAHWIVGSVVWRRQEWSFDPAPRIADDSARNLPTNISRWFHLMVLGFGLQFYWTARYESGLQSICLSHNLASNLNFITGKSCLHSCKKFVQQKWRPIFPLTWCGSEKTSFRCSESWDQESSKLSNSEIVNRQHSP